MKMEYHIAIKESFDCHDCGKDAIVFEFDGPAYCKDHLPPDLPDYFREKIEKEVPDA